jgi:hypothetical protein
MSGLWRWQRGRQGSGYDKLKIASAPWPLAFDCYLIRYPIGSQIPPHTDPVSERCHYRLNVVVRASPAGGEFFCADPIYESRRIKFFRPDLSEHSVSEVIGGPRYVLSIGWLWGRRSH